MKVAYVTGTRAEYGIMSPVLKAISNSGLDLHLIVTGMHLMPEFGLTKKEIEKDNYDFTEINAVYENDSRKATIEFMGYLMQQLPKALDEIKPDLILILGDRAESLAAAIAGQYLGIPVAHVSGGDVSGHVDDSVRHAISKLAHVHFPISKLSAQRLEKMGEDPKRIDFVGSPSLDSIKNLPNVDYGLENYAILLLHPADSELDNLEENVLSVLAALDGVNLLVISPNADAGGRKINKIYKDKGLKVYQSIPQPEFLSLMKNSLFIIGNSSSGIVESGSLGIPAINIGGRQKGRERAANVIDVSYDVSEIKSSIEKAMSEEFKETCQDCVSPYGNGNASELIVKHLKNLDIDSSELVHKRCLV